jgi:hypothetical protein
MIQHWKNAAVGFAVMIGFSGALFGQKANLAQRQARAKQVRLEHLKRENRATLK